MFKIIPIDEARAHTAAAAKASSDFMESRVRFLLVNFAIQKACERKLYECIYVFGHSGLFQEVRDELLKAGYRLTNMSMPGNVEVTVGISWYPPALQVETIKRILS